MRWPKTLALGIALAALVACSPPAGSVNTDVGPNEDSSSSDPAEAVSEASPQLRCPETEATRAFLRANPEWSAVTVDMLVHDDQKLWTAAHPGDCPGVAEIAYDGDGAPMALALVRQHPDGSREQWLVAVGSTGDVTTLDGPGRIARPAVIWRGPAGPVRDLRTDETVVMSHDPIIYETIEAGSTVFWWTADGFRSALASE